MDIEKFFKQVDKLLEPLYKHQKNALLLIDKQTTIIGVVDNRVDRLSERLDIALDRIKELEK